MARIELHCHLDGSLNIASVEEQLGRTHLKECLEVEESCKSLTEYLQKFELPLQCLQTREGLERAAFELVRDVQADDVEYMEVRFAPMLSTEKGLTCEEAVEAVVSGLAEGEKQYGTRAAAIVCMMRHHSYEQNREALLAAEKFLGQGVCALDLAGDESAFPTALFRRLFEEAKERKIPFTIHSGECGSVENVREAIELGTRRLGHGIALEQSPELRKLCREKGIGIEVCPSSNLQTGAVRDLRKHPLKLFLEEGLLVSINTDNRTVSGTTLAEEEEIAKEVIGLTEEEILKCRENAWKTAFISKR